MAEKMKYAGDADDLRKSVDKAALQQRNYRGRNDMNRAVKRARA